MHDQITLQTQDNAPESALDGRARRKLDQRWRELMSREADYRSPENQTAAAG
jgi:hypothetical protein